MSTQQSTGTLSSKPILPTWAWIVIGAILGSVLAGVVGWHEIARAADEDPEWGEGGIMAVITLFVLEALLVVAGGVLGGLLTALVAHNS